MKGITKGEWKMDGGYDGNSVVSYGDDLGDLGNIICDAPIGFDDSMLHWEANAKLICTAGNLTNAGYNIGVMPQLVEALEEMKIFYHSWLQQDSETIGYKAATKALEALKSAKL